MSKYNYSEVEKQINSILLYLEAAGEKKKLYELLRFASFVFLAVGIVSYVSVVLFSVHFYRIFTPNADSVAMFAADRSKLYFFGFMFSGINILMISFFQATAATGKSLLLSSLRGFILPAIFVFSIPVIFGTEMLWGCHSAAETATLIICIIIFTRKKCSEKCLGKSSKY